MEDLVYLSPNTKDPFTTSEVIAECTGVQHHTITRLIQQHRKDFKEFGILRFEIEEIKGRGQPRKTYHLNEQQATLLMTYLRNTEVVREFKKELVRQFYAMREELQEIRIQKAMRKPIRLGMTDAIQALPDSPHKQFKYRQYTDLAYRAVLGKSAKELREERGASKTATASDYMSAAEIEAVSRMENRIAVLLEVGLDYGQIKACLGRMHTLPRAAGSQVS